MPQDRDILHTTRVTTDTRISTGTGGKGDSASTAGNIGTLYRLRQPAGSV